MVVNIHLLNISTDESKDDVVKILRSLKTSISNGSDVTMQEAYPEGYIFLNVLYGLAWSNVAGDNNSLLHDEAITEVQHAIDKIFSITGQAPFTKELSIPYGAFYTGWSTYLLGKKLMIQMPVVINNNQVKLFKNNCESIARAFSEQKFPVSYYDQAWPADAVVCISSLVLHDQIFEPRYQTITNQWINDVKIHLDEHGLIPHAVDPLNTSTLESSRGSSMALMLFFLKDIDQDFAEDQYKLFKKFFLDNKFGLTGILEYPKGEFGLGDVDSGPVLLGFGGAATIVGCQVLFLYGDLNEGSLVEKEVEALTLGCEWFNRKQYLLGLLPMVDAFIAWGKSNTLTYDRSVTQFYLFHSISIVLFFLLAVWFWILVQKPKPDSKKLLHKVW